MTQHELKRTITVVEVPETTKKVEMIGKNLL